MNCNVNFQVISTNLVLVITYPYIKFSYPYISYHFIWAPLQPEKDLLDVFIIESYTIFHLDLLSNSYVKATHA